MLKLIWLLLFGKKKDFDQKFFEWFWDHYAPWAKYLQWVDPYKWMINDAMAQINPREGDNILDVGCGCAVMSCRIISKQPRIGKILGIDVSTDLPARVLRELDGKFRFKPHDLMLGIPSDNEDFKKKSFSWIVANMVITYFPEQVLDMILSDIYELMSDDGTFVFTTPREKVNFWIDYKYSFKSMFSFGPDGMWGLWAAIHILPHVLMLMKLGRFGFCTYLNEKSAPRKAEQHGFKVEYMQSTFVDQGLLVVLRKK